MASFSWTPFVFIRYFLFMTAGILFALWFKPSFPLFLITGLLSFFLFLSLFFVLKKHQHYRFQMVFCILGGFFLFSAGVISVHINNATHSPSHIIHGKEKILWYKGIVDNEVIERKKSFRTEVEISAIKTMRGWEPAKGRIMVFLLKRDSLKLFEYGDEIIVKGSPSLVPPPANPGEFDYRSFLNNLQIYHQHFLKRYEIISSGKGNPIIAFSLQSRKVNEEVFKKYIDTERERSVALALILGAKTDLDEQLKKAYSGTGVMHILAVSGMHVCLVFQILVITLGKLKLLRGGKFIFAGVALTLIWFYAFVTGLSASVLRAVVMFTIILLGEAFGRQKSSVNNYFSSAFLLLLYNPYLLLNIGFQLSYLAVLGIIVLYPKIYSLLTFNNRIKDYFWQIIAVSIAAQLATSPLSILYFHQFPTAFLIANIILIPIVSGAMYLGVFLLKASFFPVISFIIGRLLEWLLWLANTLVFCIFEFPYSFIVVNFTAFEAILVYVIIVLLYLLFKKRQLKYLQFTLAITIVYSASDVYNFYVRQNTRSLIVFKGSEKIELLFGTNRVALSDLQAIKEVSGIRIFCYNKKVIAVADQPISTFPHIAKEKIKVDALIVRNNSLKNLSSICDVFYCGTVVFDDDNDRRDVKRLLEQFPKSLAVHPVAEKGAFVMSF